MSSGGRGHPYKKIHNFTKLLQQGRSCLSHPRCRLMPKPPSEPCVASRWVALLAHGALDAAAHAEHSPLLLDMLWSATKHAHAEVRGAAYEALAHYPMETLEALEALRWVFLVA